MKALLRSLLLILLVEFLLPRCANPGRPSGGPKDTIPPELITSTPIIGQKNFDEQIITLEFTEFINADKIQQQLIITPRTDVKYKSIVKREKLIIKLYEKLADSTTYNFNFASGITDITEKNPALNLSLAFSTGPNIDSMQISGTVTDLLTQQAVKKYLVGLYPHTDSLDLLKDKPVYFTSTQDSGRFDISYIKPGEYKLLAFEDKNSNQTLDPQEESHAFKEGIIYIDTTIHLAKPIRALLQNVKPIEIINVRPTGLYIEVKVNKYISEYHIEPAGYYHHLVGENLETIRIYKPDTISFSDSIRFKIMVKDSLENIDYDTTKLTFLPTNRKATALTIKKVQESIMWSDTLSMSIRFNKPISITRLDSIYISADSSSVVAAPTIANWNNNQTIVRITSIIKKDSLLKRISQLLPPDTTSLDTLGNYEINSKAPDQLISNIPLQLTIPDSAFISVEKDTTRQITWSIRKPTKNKGGTLIINLTTETPSYTFQLLSGDVPKYQIKNKQQFTLPNVSPGKYTIRVLIDTNNDGNWSFGNLLQDKEPEEVFLYGEEISIRENWVNEFTIAF